MKQWREEVFWKHPTWKKRLDPPSNMLPLGWLRSQIIWHCVVVPRNRCYWTHWVSWGLKISDIGPHSVVVPQNRCYWTHWVGWDLKISDIGPHSVVVAQNRCYWTHRVSWDLKISDIDPHSSVAPQNRCYWTPDKALAYGKLSQNEMYTCLWPVIWNAEESWWATIKILGVCSRYELNRYAINTEKGDDKISSGTTWVCDGSLGSRVPLLTRVSRGFTHAHQTKTLKILSLGHGQSPYQWKVVTKTNCPVFHLKDFF